MPCNYKEYHPKWSLISHLVRNVRAKGCCEWCGVPNGSVGRWENDTWVTPTMEEQEAINNLLDAGQKFWPTIKRFGFTKIILTVAHLDHDKNNNRFENLAALCQREHLAHDIKQHADNRRYGRNWKNEQQLKLEFK